MTIRPYGVLVGQVTDQRTEREDKKTPHYQVRVHADGTDYRLAVNVRSQGKKPDLLFLAREDFAHLVVGSLRDLTPGFHDLASQPGGAALDYIRANLFDPAEMRLLTATEPGPDNDLADKLDHYTKRAHADPQALVYAFGQRWINKPDEPDDVFGFPHGTGIHDIHMNQGNDADHVKDDGVWQDGALLFRFPDQDQWVAIFLAFQSQAWHTDDLTGHALVGTGGDQGGTGGPQGPDGDRGQRPMQILAALVNPVGGGIETETVTLLNASPEPIDLTGWRLLDRGKQAMTLDGTTVGAGQTHIVHVNAPVHLGNHGGAITLLDPEGLKVDGVAYTDADASRPGWTITF